MFLTITKTVTREREQRNLRLYGEARTSADVSGFLILLQLVLQSQH
jgi:hypothetical protein